MSQMMDSSLTISTPVKNAFKLMLCLAAALLLTYLLRSPAFTVSQDYVLFLLFFSVGLWLTEAIPPFAVALFIMAFLFFALGNPRFNPQPQDASKYVQTFSSSIIWLLLGGFFLAEAMTKTGIDSELLKLSLKLSGSRPRTILFALMITTLVASMFLSNTATTAMVIAAIMPLLNHLGNNPFAKTLLTGIPLAAAVGGMGTIIGSPTNAIAAGALENVGITISFLKWMMVGVPLALVLILISWRLLCKFYIPDNSSIAIEFLQENQQEPLHGHKRNRRIVMIIFTITVLLWTTSSLHQLSVSAVSAIPLIFLTMTGILNASDMRKLPWDTLMLVSGGLSLGLALQHTGMLEYFAAGITESGFSTVLLYFIFAFSAMLFSNVMSNTATSTILIPLGIYLMPAEAERIAVIIGLAASTALLLPVSTPPNAIAYSTGLLKQKDFLPGGLLMGIIGPLLIVLSVMLLLR
jgi:sodium-dependent dicarboxylate transporter 2/3/5